MEMRGSLVAPAKPARATLVIVWMLVSTLVVGCGGGEQAAPPAPGPDTVEVDVYLTNPTLGDLCTDVFPVPRTVDGDDPVVGALQALIAGPTDVEVRQGYGGWFSAETADVLLDVEITDGTVHVTFADLRQVIPNASSSCGSTALLAQLDTTLLALEGIDATRYAMADQAAFYGWLQLPDPDAPATSRPPAAEDEPGGPSEPDEPSEPGEASEPIPVIDHDTGWTPLPDYGWPITPQCCGAPTTGPPSPRGPLPEQGWPADGYYDVDVVRPSTERATLELQLRRWVVPDEMPEHWEGTDDVIDADPGQVIRREVAIAELAVVLVPIQPEGDHEVTGLTGGPGAFATLLADGIDPAYLAWVVEPLRGGTSVEAIETDLLARSAAPGFPFGQDYRTGLHPDAPIAFRGPLGSSLVADPSWMSTAWPPGHNGLYGWDAITLEVRDGRPILHLWAGQIAG
jgi:hypothetical protein